MALTHLATSFVKSGNLHATEVHNHRLFQTDFDDKHRINAVASKDNVYLQMCDDGTLKKVTKTTAKPLQEIVDAYIERNQIKGLKKGKTKSSPVCIQAITSVTDTAKFAEENGGMNKVLNAMISTMSEYYGCKPISVSLHMDESNPHLHMLFIPFATKEVHFKNRYGESSRTENRLDIQRFIWRAGGAHGELHKAQETFNQGMRKIFGDNIQELSPSAEKRAMYVKKCNWRIAELLKQIEQGVADADDAMRKIELLREQMIAQEQAQKEKDRLKQFPLPHDYINAPKKEVVFRKEEPGKNKKNGRKI